jgi:hypothetical protein
VAAEGCAASRTFSLSPAAAGRIAAEMNRKLSKTTITNFVFFVVEVFVLVLVVEVLVLVVVIEVLVFLFVLFLVFEFFLFFFVVEFFVEGLAGAIAGFLAATGADAVLKRSATGVARGASA